MTDKELLELAAKAAGLFPTTDCLNNLAWTTGNGSGCFQWNPLTDDGDALRLAMQLGLVINCRHSQSLVETRNEQFWEAHINGEDVATRRAIVRAAAEIGKDMK